MTNENEKKIEQIRNYLSQANCAGVEVVASRRGEVRDPELIDNINAKHSLTIAYANSPAWQIEILDIKPIPIELEPLSEGDKVWVDGKIGKVVDVLHDCYIEGYFDGLYQVSIKDTFYQFERHELLKVVG